MSRQSLISWKALLMDNGRSRAENVDLGPINGAYRSSMDCLIAQTAIEHGLHLLHNDSDFDRIAKVSALKIW